MKRWITAALAVTTIILLCCAGCGASISKADLAFYDKNGIVAKTLGEERSEQWISCGDGEVTSRKIGRGSTFAEAKEAYKDIWDKMFNISSYGKSSTMYFDWGDGIMIMERSLDDEESKITGLTIYAKEAYEAQQFIYTMSSFRYNAERGMPMFYDYRGIYDKFIGSLTEDEMLMVNKLAARTDTDKYSSGETFYGFNEINGCDDMDWLSQGEKKTVMGIYEKFKKNYAFGY